MTHIFRKPLGGLLLLFLLCLQGGFLQVFGQVPNNPWAEKSANAIVAKGKRFTIPQKFRSYSLDLNGMRRLLQQAPSEKNASPRTSRAIITLPLPNGSFARFRVVASSIMAPDLAAAFPAITTYIGTCVDDPSLTVSFDLTPSGFHGMLHSAAEGLSFIDPYSQGDQEHYILYRKKEYTTTTKQFAEGEISIANPTLLKAVEDRVKEKRAARMQASETVERPSGDLLRTYRVAIAATGEYTAFHGGTVSAALSAIVTTLNRVNFIFIRELSIRMLLVSNNAAIIYTNGSTDPYSNGDARAMLTQNQSNINTVIGAGSYDIGHVFGTNSGGVAGLGVVCNDVAKARGVTGSGAPIGDAFDVDYVAHEMGHQFGANHTFNGNEGACAGSTRVASTAYEPGSGSSIMGYAGICGTQNLQPNSDACFHTASYDEIMAFSEINGGSTCAALTPVDNTAPMPAIVSPDNLTIPKGTPFTIVGTAVDNQNDPITYSWEQFDLGPAGSPNDPGGNAPIFRSFTATSTGSRTFPRLSDLLNNTATIGEQLPTYARTLHFNLTVRDNFSSGGGVEWAYPLTVNVSGTAGPFLVTAPNTNITWTGGSSRTITWDVAGTNAVPISCSQVNILLSTDGGISFPTVLASNTPNDGSHTITVPNVETASARIKVEAAGNIFFDLSNANFSITESVPVITSIGPAKGPVGMGVCIQGKNFINVAAIKFNGVTATQTYLASNELLYAAVPTGATSGKVEVITQGGSASSTTNFNVGTVTSSWVSKASLATARLQHGTIGTNGRIYVFGGRTGSTTLNSIEIYNPASNSWTAGAPLPQATRGMATALGFNGAIYIFGGVSGTIISNAYRYEPSANTWSAMASMPVALFEAAAAATPNGKVYVFGGEPSAATGTSANTTHIYDIATNSWSAGAAMPVGVHQHSATTGSDGKIYIMGGRAFSSGAPLGLVQIYNPASNTWTIGTAMPIPKVQFGAIKAANGKIYVVGGKASDSNSSGPFFNTVEIYTPGTNTWSTGPVLPRPIGQQTAVKLNDELYAIGGTDGSVRNSVYQLPMVPVAPSKLVATAVSASQINLSWKDNSKNETAFVIERALTSGGAYTVIASVGADIISFSNTGLNAATTYYYRVKASSVVGSSPYSGIANAQTLGTAASIAAHGRAPEIAETATTVFRAFPNPAGSNGKVKLSFAVATDQQVQLMVLDQAGRVVQQLFRGHVLKGQTYNLDWDTGNRTPGTYIVRLLTSEGSFATIVLITP